MGLPGVVVNVLDGNLALSPGSNEHTALLMGPCTLGTPNTLYNYSDAATMAQALGAGELVELAGYLLANSGGPVQIMPMTPDTQGGVSAVTHVGTGAMTATLTEAPTSAITITCTTSGTLGTAAFTFQVGSGAASAPVVSASSWSSTGYLVPGTYCIVIFTAGSYVGSGTVDTYIISTLGAISHPTGAGPAVPTITASPVDSYVGIVTVTTAGAVGTSQITYSLDNGVTTSSAVVTAATYAIPGTGVVLGFSGTAVVGDTYSFKTAGMSSSASALASAITALETTYLNQIASSIVCLCGSGLAAASAWATQCATLETFALSMFSNGIYLRCMNLCPTIGSISASGGAVVVDSTDTDSTVITQRLTVSAVYVAGCAGNAIYVNPVSGLSLLRGAQWAAITRAVAVEASQNLGFVGLGGLPGITSIVRDENKTPALDAAGFITLRTFPGFPGFYITGAYTLTFSTSDYYPLTNARVIDLGCGITRAQALPLVNSKIPTTTRNNQAGVITEKKAQQIEAQIDSALNTQLVNTVPQDAVAAGVTVNRSHNILSDGNLILAVAIQPFAYARLVTVNIGLAVSA